MTLGYIHLRGDHADDVSELSVPGSQRRRSRTFSSWLGLPLAFLSLAALLTACTAPTVIADSTVTVATSQAFFSLNDKTSYGASTANSAIVQAVNSSFNRYDDVPKLVTDPSFGSYHVVSTDPLTVTYTIADGVTWSDGVPVDASDLLLAWAANSGALNTKDFDDSDFVNPDTGEYARPFPSDVVHFDGATSEGLQYVTQTPVIGANGRSLTLRYDRYFADWPLVLQVGVPAHVVAAHALDMAPQSGTGSGPSDSAPSDSAPSDSHVRAAAKAASDALVNAIDTNDTAKLSALANFWNSGFNFDAMPKDASLLVSDGPYTISDFSPGEQLTLTANSRYSGTHKPVIETVVVSFVPDGLTQLAALEDGSVNVVQPSLNADVVARLDRARDVTVQDGVDGVYEHLDLQFSESSGGAFDNVLVRQAFLKTVPRTQILDELITPLRPDAEVRSSHMFLPGEPGYQRSAQSNGSSAFSRVDIPGAVALLAKAGVTNPTVCILFDPDNPKRVQEFQLIRASAAEAGFRVTNCSSSDWMNLLGTPGSYDASIFAWNVTNQSISGVSAIFGTGGRNNLNYYSNQQVDALFKQLAVADDDAKSTAIRQQIDALVFADAYGVPLYQNPVVVAFDHTITGVKLAPFSPGIFWNLWEWKPASASPSSVK